MQLVCVSRGTYSSGIELAEGLAEKLGARCVRRETLIEEAVEAGIAVGRLETAIVKRRPLDERLMLDKEQYQAFATVRICEQALAGRLVYHGRTGHLLFPGLAHVFRVRVVEELDRRVQAAMARLGTSWSKARQYVETVDEDIRRWVKTMYGVDFDASAHYDVVVNLQQMGVGNVATALCSMATLPDFQSTPASARMTLDLLLAARVRLALAHHDRTHDALFRVQARDGEVLVTYQPRDAHVAGNVEGVVGAVEGVRSVTCTMATTTILWIQERYDADKPTYGEIVGLARRWNAAVKLVRLAPGAAAAAAPAAEAAARATGMPPASRTAVGGIEDDVEAPEEGDDGGLRAVHESLTRDGVAGGFLTACCAAERLPETVDGGGEGHSLVVLGEIGSSEGAAVRKRMQREVAGRLGETLKVPVVSPAELRETYRLTGARAVRIGLLLLLAAAFVAAALLNEERLLELLHPQRTGGKVLAALAVPCIAAGFAWIYGSFTHAVLKLIGME